MEINEEFIKNSLQLAISEDKLKQAAAQKFKEGLPYKLAGQLFLGKTYLCLWCGGEIEGFRDHLSAKEFRASGLCQPCQDKAFEAEKERKKNK
jgi:hypothetical protein